jgi:hypothetical protein
MAIDDNSLTVFNRQLEMDELDRPVGSAAITGTAKVLGAVSQVPALRPLGLIAKGFDLAGKCLNIGVPTVEENLKLFGVLTEEAILRVEERLAVLEATASSAKDLQRRMESKEFSQYLASGVLQTQRTTQESRLKRMAWIIANGLKENDLDIESGDDMMRAAVELKDADIVLLGNLYKWQNRILAEKGMNPDKWFSDIQTAHKQLVESGALKQQDHLTFRSSYMRLESLGLIQEIPSINNHYGVGYEVYALLLEGKKFYERLQEIAP